YDVQHYTIRVSFDRAAKTVSGDTTVRIKPLKRDFRAIDLDAAEIDFESVKLEPENKNLVFRTAGEKIFITLDKAYSPQDLINIRFKYSAKPKKGVYFIDELKEDGQIVRARQIWTQGEPNEAHHWFPSYDFPDDKATSEQFLTIGKNETAIANGELIETTENTNETKTVHYKMPIAHSTYLTSFVIGTYSKVSDSYKNIPLGFYIYPGKEAVAQKAFGKTKDMMRVFEELTGVEFPYNKYDQTIVANFQFGGMENITATTLADSEILLVEFGFAGNIVEDLVSHELAHSWFGNLVTCKNWSELWLNEGFATYMEAAYREKMYGRADYLRKIGSDAEQFIINDAVNKNRFGLFNQTAGNVSGLFDNPAITYNKGGAVVHTLRETVGTENFWKAINVYLNRHKFGNVESTDLQKAMEEVSSMNLDWFFAQWIYGGGHPKLNVKQVYNPKTKVLTLTVAQIQTPDKLTVSAFRLPMDVTVTTVKGTKTENIEIKKRLETFSLKLDGKPSKIVLDKDEKIPLKLIKYQDMIVLKGQ
ncbi:MAG: M1 family metallopeptidase, partial [Acidobacteria bacterium]|nr:M1 family metallopeptidase [Acidobacteriota bacterium]